MIGEDAERLKVAAESRIELIALDEFRDGVIGSLSKSPIQSISLAIERLGCADWEAAETLYVKQTRKDRVARRQNDRRLQLIAILLGR